MRFEATAGEASLVYYIFRKWFKRIGPYRYLQMIGNKGLTPHGHGANVD